MIGRREVLRLGVAAAAAALTPGRAAAATPAPLEPRREAPGQSAPAHGGRSERRGVLGRDRHPADLPVDAAAVRLRPDVHDARRRRRAAPAVERRAHDLRVLLPRRAAGDLRLHAPAGAACPPPPDRSQGYVWPLFSTWDIVAADADGSNLTRLTDNDTYDAECAVSPDGRRIVFTSLARGRPRPLPHGRRRRQRAPADRWARLRRRRRSSRGTGASSSFGPSRPESREELEEYRALLARGLVRPRRLDIYLMNADGTGLRRVTRLAGANFAPFMHPNSRQIIFSSNLHDPSGRSFALYLVDLDGSRPGAGDVGRRFRVLSDVHARRQAPGVLRQPRRRRPSRPRRLRRRLGRSMSPRLACDRLDLE